MIAAFQLAVAKIAAGIDADCAGNRFLEALQGKRLARRFQVLAYHKVSPDPHPFFPPVDPAFFEQQMKFLSQCYRVMPLMELVERSFRGDLPESAVAITFDDGYADNYQYAFPILKKYRLPATIFITTGAIDTGELLWHDRIFDAFRFATAASARLPESDLPELILEPALMRNMSILPVLAKAKELYGEARRRFVESVEAALKPNVAAVTANRMLTWDQIREMRATGIEFGSHTVSHPVLSRLPQQELVRELEQSRQDLQEQLNEPIRSFAYPNGHAGDYNDEVKRALMQSGYSCAVTSEFGLNDALSDPYELKRGQPWHDRIELFRLAFFMQRHGWS